MRLEPAQAEHLPGEIDHVAHPDFLQHVRRLERAGDARQEIVIGGRVLALDQRRRGEIEDRGGSRGALGCHGKIGSLGHASPRFANSWRMSASVLGAARIAADARFHCV